MNHKCVYCDSSKVIEVAHEDGENYILPIIHIPTHDFRTKGVPLKAYCCLECGGIMLFMSDSFYQSSH